METDKNRIAHNFKLWLQSPSTRNRNLYPIYSLEERKGLPCFLRIRICVCVFVEVYYYIDKIVSVEITQWGATWENVCIYFLHSFVFRAHINQRQEQ